MNKILMYHSVGKKGSDEIGADLYSVSNDNFIKQLDYLSIHFPDAVITFDDGLLDNFTVAYPILKKYKFPVYIFILAPKIGKSGYMNWEEVGQLSREGVIIGSHGLTHRILTEMDERSLDYEIEASKQILEEKLKTGIEYFSIPRGFYDTNIIRKAKKAGYKAVFTSEPRDNDGFKLGRLAVKGEWDLKKFKRMLNNELFFRERTAEFLKNSSKKILGAGNYEKVRNQVLKK